MLVLGGDLPGPLPQAALVQRADLLQQNHTVPCKAAVSRTDADVGGQAVLVLPGGDGGGNNGGAVAVAHVILHDQNRADAALLRPDHRAEIGIKNFASMYFHGTLSSVLQGQPRGRPYLKNG